MLDFRAGTCLRTPPEPLRTGLHPHWSPVAFVPHLRVSFSGTMGPAATPAEIFSFNVCLSPPPSSPVPGRGDLTTMAAGCSTGLLPLLNRISNGAQVRRTRVALVGPEGKVLRDDTGAYLQGDDETVRVGSGGPPTYPTQIALAVSLVTGTPDAVGRGRFYLPSPINPVGADMRLAEADIPFILGDLRTFLVNVQTACNGSPDPVLCVASQGSVSKGIAPQNRTVTAIRVGRVLDTMRSRRNQLEEEHQLLPFPS